MVEKAPKGGAFWMGESSGRRKWNSVLEKAIERLWETTWILVIVLFLVEKVLLPGRMWEPAWILGVVLLVKKAQLPGRI